MYSRKTSRFVALALCMILVLSCFAGCGGSGTETGDDAAKVAKVYVPDIFNTLNPFNTGAFSDSYVFCQVYETLFTVDDSGVPQPQLAESYEISEDALTYTVKLREDAVFENGEPFKASDVVFTYEYAKGFAAKTAFYGMVEKVTALDDYTVEFKLDNPTPLFLGHTQQMPIVNEKFVNDNGGDISKVACGTGPYTIVSYDPATKVVLTAKDDYRAGKAAVEDVELCYISDGSSATIQLETGDLNFMNLDPTSVELFKGNDKFVTKEVPSMYCALITMNTEVKPFDNKAFRQALSYACDRESIVITSFEGLGSPAYLQADTSTFGVDMSLADDYTYNVDKAKEKLAEAGFPDGVNLTEEYGIYLKTIPGTHHEKTGQAFQKNLADIGVIVELQNTQTPDEDVESGNYAIMNQGATYRTDFSYNECSYGALGMNGNNYSRMKESYVDEMFAKGAAETDPEKRIEIYKELIAFIVDYCPTIPVVFRQNVYAWSADLNATAHSNSMFPFFCYEWSWK
ncbi:MAG: ABC transporter substrate-binding protein [Firmicutes bacterium]|nr:ABC transporter substrate-binding protein [Bacillota bacterium]